MSDQDDSSKFKKKPLDNAYLKYSGMAFQIIAYLVVGIFLGRKLDQYFELEKPIFTAVLATLFLGAFFFKLFADLNQNKPK